MDNGEHWRGTGFKGLKEQTYPRRHLALVTSKIVKISSKECFEKLQMFEGISSNAARKMQSKTQTINQEISNLSGWR